MDIVRRAVAEKRYLNEKGLPSPLFQADKLIGSQPVFVVEGVFDALSAEELGYHAAALNGSGNREKAAALLRTPSPTGLQNHKHTGQNSQSHTWKGGWQPEAKHHCFFS